MDFERGSEYMPTPPPEMDAGYSEKASAQVTEGVQQDLKNQKKRTPAFSVVSRKEKIITAYKNNLDKIIALVESISRLEGINHRQEEQIVDEIKSIRHLQEELLNALLLEQKGILTEESISKDAWALIV